MAVKLPRSTKPLYFIDIAVDKPLSITTLPVPLPLYLLHNIANMPPVPAGANMGGPSTFDKRKYQPPG